MVGRVAGAARPIMRQKQMSIAQPNDGFVPGRAVPYTRCVSSTLARENC